jgi:hypothetical protein
MGWRHTQGKRLQGYESNGSDSDGNGRKNRVNGVNPDSSRSIYRWVYPIRLLWLLPPYYTHHNDYIPTILREDYAGLFTRQASHDLSSEFRSSDTLLASGHFDERTSITTMSISPHITLI